MRKCYIVKIKVLKTYEAYADSKLDALNKVKKLLSIETLSVDIKESNN